MVYVLQVIRNATGLDMHPVSKEQRVTRWHNASTNIVQ